MTQRILKFGGIDPLSRTESEHGDAEPDEDPRGRKGTEIVRGMHLMNAVEQLEPSTTTNMAYFDPDAPDVSLEELEEAVREGDLSLSDVMTKTERFTPLVNPRRSRLKSAGELPGGSDQDLWHVPTSNYQAMPPRSIFTPLASAIDANDSITNSGVFGEFRERRNGGEVFGEVWFEDFDVGAIDSDPVRLGYKFGWNYFGDRAFFIQPWAQQTRCKNSVAPLDDRETIMHHNKTVDWRDVWDEALRDLGLYGDDLSHSIRTARDILFRFDSYQSGLNQDDEEDEVIPVPLSVEGFYEYAGFPDPRIPAEHARDEATNSADDRQSSRIISAWNLHAGATFWLAWHWNGSEDSRAFREYRRTANDMLFNPNLIVDRVRSEYEQDEQQQIVTQVLGDDRSLEDATQEELDEIDSRVADHEGIVTVNAGADRLEDMIEQFEDTEERLDRMQQAISGGE